MPSFKLIKKTILGLIALASIYLLALVIMGLFLPQPLRFNLPYKLGSYGQTNTRLKEFKNTNNYDLLILGPSIAYRDFDPRIFKTVGWNLFNLGTSAQTPVNTLDLLKTYDSLLIPGVKAIYAFHPKAFELDGTESLIDFLANDDFQWRRFKTGLFSGNLKAFNSALFASIDHKILGNPSRFEEGKTRRNDTYIPGGFVEKELEFFSPKSFPKQSFNYSFEQWQAFKEIIDLLQSKNIEVCVVFPPVSNSIYSSYLNPLELEDSIQQLTPFVNYNPAQDYSDSLHFYDHSHMNQEGVKKFNLQVIDLLHQMGWSP